MEVGRKWYGAFNSTPSWIMLHVSPHLTLLSLISLPPTLLSKIIHTYQFYHQSFAILDSPQVLCLPLLSAHSLVPFCSCSFLAANPTDNRWKWDWWGCIWRCDVYGGSPFQTADHTISSLPVLMHSYQNHVSAFWDLAPLGNLVSKERHS